MRGHSAKLTYQEEQKMEWHIMPTVLDIGSPQQSRDDLGPSSAAADWLEVNMPSWFLQIAFILFLMNICAFKDDALPYSSYFSLVVYDCE